MRKLAWMLLAGCSAAPAPECPTAVGSAIRVSACAPAVAIPHPPIRRSPGTVFEGEAIAAEGETRTVRFALNPGGARLVVDDRPVPWFGVHHELPLGEHTLAIEMPRELAHCCLPVHTKVVITAGDELEVISIHLPYQDAKVVLVDGPGYGFLACKELGIVIAESQLVAIPMHEIEWRGRCTSESGARVAVQLRAGETTVVPWPLP
jgi:hypothetical protein